VLDQGYKWDLTDEEAQELGRRSIYAAGHRDAFSGNTCNLYQVKEDGWDFIGMLDFLTLSTNSYWLLQARTIFRRCTMKVLGRSLMGIIFELKQPWLLNVKPVQPYHAYVNRTWTALFLMSGSDSAEG